MDDFKTPSPTMIPGTYWSLRGQNCEVTLQPRPTYCDRGQFLAMLEVDSGQYKLHVDSADNWPRYYFTLENALEEIKLWLIKRNQVYDMEWRTHVAGE